METLEAILSRRSIRSFKNVVIEQDIIKKLLKSAMAAPSARNYQPWHFIVISDRDLLNEIPRFHPYSEMLKQASHAIAVCGDLKLEKLKEYIVLDCAAATQNILLAAHDLGLGAVWLGIYPRQERVNGLKELLNIPPDIIPVSLIALGYAAEDKSKEDRYKESRIHNNKWSVK